MNRPVHSAECLVERMDACLAARSVVHLVVSMEGQWVARWVDYSVALWDACSATRNSKE